MGFWALGMRAMMVTVQGEDYVTLRRGEGTEAHADIFFRYALRNAILPQMTALALALGSGRIGRGAGRGRLRLSGSRQASSTNRSAPSTTP